MTQPFFCQLLLIAHPGHRVLEAITIKIREEQKVPRENPQNGDIISQHVRVVQTYLKYI